MCVNYKNVNNWWNNRSILFTQKFSRELLWVSSFCLFFLIKSISKIRHSSHLMSYKMTVLLISPHSTMITWSHRKVTHAVFLSLMFFLIIICMSKLILNKNDITSSFYEEKKGASRIINITWMWIMRIRFPANNLHEEAVEENSLQK